MDDNDKLAWDIGSVFMMGFTGTTVTPQLKQLIEEHHLGTVMISGKNFKCMSLLTTATADQATKLILELQTIARDAGHRHPLLIAIDQENGGLNNLCDPTHIRQFPGAMGMAATGSTQLCREVAKATALEVSSVGINWVLGPVLDVLNVTSRNQPLGVRTMGHDPQEVSEMGVAFMQGLQDGGVATCGKHFPSYGNIEFQGSPLDVPIVNDTIEQLQLHGLVPFRKAIAANIDAVMVGGCSMPSLGTKVMHACLSDAVINKLLREDLGFQGVVVSECLEMEALHENIGVGQATVMALDAGCDQIIVCRSFTLQLEAIQGLQIAVESGLISRETVSASAARVAAMKETRTSWQQALSPGGVDYLTLLAEPHLKLSKQAYEASITVVRDEKQLLPVASTLGPDDEILLLTPLVKPLPASLLAQSEALNTNSRADHRSDHSPTPTSSTPRQEGKSFLTDKDRVLMTGEAVFRDLGRSLARNTGTRVLHTSYTANGIRPVHENLIENASLIILVTADANQNRYQYGFTKHISTISKVPTEEFPKGRSLMVIAASSPYDFWMDKSIGTYVCTYDFTETAIDAMVEVLFARKPPKGQLPGTIFKSIKQKQQQPKQRWLVEHWKKSRDLNSLQDLLNVVRLAKTEQENPQYCQDLLGLPANLYSVDEIFYNDSTPIIEQQNFVVRNSSTRALFGFCSTYYNPRTGNGSIGLIVVDPTRRNLSIGNSLHSTALHYLKRKKGVKTLSVGARFPGLFLGVPISDNLNLTPNTIMDGLIPSKNMKTWFSNLGWPETIPSRVYRLVLSNLAAWQAPSALSKSLSETSTSFDLISQHTAVKPHHLFDVIMENATSADKGRYLDAYRVAADDLETGMARILVALNAQKQVVGSVILVWLSGGNSKMEKFVPWIRIPGPNGRRTGGILYPAIQALPTRRLILEGLVAISVRHFQMQQQQGASFERCALDSLDDADDVQAICNRSGWGIWHTFEEIGCSASDWKA